MQPSSGARCLFGRTLRLLPHFMCANSEGSGETARMRRLAWAFACRLYDKYHNLMCWLILFVRPYWNTCLFAILWPARKFAAYPNSFMAQKQIFFFFFFLIFEISFLSISKHLFWFDMHLHIIGSNNIPLPLAGAMCIFMSRLIHYIYVCAVKFSFAVSLFPYFVTLILI